MRSQHENENSLAGSRRPWWAVWRSPDGQPGWARRNHRQQRDRDGVRLQRRGIWLLTFGGIFTVMGTIPHTAYIASLAPPLAALGGAGIVLAWQAYRAGGRAAWLLPAAVLAELAWAGWLWSGYASFLPWARWAVLAAGLAATAVLVVGRDGSVSRDRLAWLPAWPITAALTVAVTAMLASPAIWSASVLDIKYAGTAYDAGAGPAGPVGPAGPNQGQSCGQASPAGSSALCAIADRRYEQGPPHHPLGRPALTSRANPDPPWL